MFDLILDSVEDFHTVVERRLHRIFGGLGVKGMSVPTLCRIAKVLRLSTDYILWGKDDQDNPDSVMMVLENCSERERTYAEQLLKTFVAAMNSNDHLV